MATFLTVNGDVRVVILFNSGSRFKNLRTAGHVSLYLSMSLLLTSLRLGCFKFTVGLSLSSEFSIDSSKTPLKVVFGAVVP